jgi:DNA primase
MRRTLATVHALKERIRKANPIEAVIGEALQLRRNGHALVGAHHTHSSKSGTSFHVDPDHGLYYCFNCGEGGDVFDWIMSLQPCTFPEALRYLAQRAHSPCPIGPTRSELGMSNGGRTGRSSSGSSSLPLTIIAPS